MNCTVLMMGDPLKLVSVSSARIVDILWISLEKTKPVKVDNLGMMWQIAIYRCREEFSFLLLLLEKLLAKLFGRTVGHLCWTSIFQWTIVGWNKCRMTYVCLHKKIHIMIELICSGQTSEMTICATIDEWDE